MKGIIGINIPLLRREKVPHVCDHLLFGLGDEVMDGLHEAILISDREAGASPRFAVYAVSRPATCWGRLRDGECARRFDVYRFDRTWIFQKESRMNIRGQYVTGDSDGNRASVFRERLLNVADGVGDKKFDAVGF